MCVRSFFFFSEIFSFLTKLIFDCCSAGKGGASASDLGGVAVPPEVHGMFRFNACELLLFCNMMSIFVVCGCVEAVPLFLFDCFVVIDPSHICFLLFCSDLFTHFLREKCPDCYGDEYKLPAGLRFLFDSARVSGAGSTMIVRECYDAVLEIIDGSLSVKDRDLRDTGSLFTGGQGNSKVRRLHFCFVFCCRQ